MIFHLFPVVFSFAVDAALISKTSMSLDKFVLRDARATLKGVDILSKASV